MNSADRMMTSGHRKLFQVAMNAKTANVASAGRIERQHDLDEDPEVPGAVEARRLVEVVGTWSMAWRSRNTPKAEAIVGQERGVGVDEPESCASR